MGTGNGKVKSGDYKVRSENWELGSGNENWTVGGLAALAAYAGDAG